MLYSICIIISTPMYWLSFNFPDVGLIKSYVLLIKIKHDHVLYICMDGQILII